MNHADPHGAGDDNADDLPPLPISRPGERSPLAASPPSPLAPPALGGGLGGGASFTAAGEDDPKPSTTSDSSAELEWSHAERERRDAERFTWEIAARLTSGLLANPGRGNSSVKDAMGLFDQLLQEMNAYTRIASEFEPLGGEMDRRRSHEEYFRNRGASASSTADPATPQASATPSPAGAIPTPEPIQPRPMGNYRPIPPGARGPYSPGSMAGTPPPERQPGDAGEQAA